MKRWLSRDMLVLALTVLVLVTPLMAGGLYVYNKHQWALARLAELEPRYARFVGMEAGQQELAKATEHAQTLLQQYVYPQEKDLSQAGNDAQQRVRDILSAAGLQVGSSQVLPPKGDAGFDRIQLTVRAEGELVGLQGALIGLSTLKPAIFVDNMTATVMGTPRAEAPQKLAIQFSLSALRTHP